MNAKTFDELQQIIARRQPLEAKLKELRNQKWEYERNVISLRVALRQEQEDVEKLEVRSLANYFFQVIGQLDDKLDKERREAYAAQVKLDAAQRELDAVAHDIAEIQTQLTEVMQAEKQYRDALEQKRMTLRESGTQSGERILELEAQIAGLESHKKEIREAISAGYSAKGTADHILSELNSADNWNTWDMFGGGGIITHVAKHSHLDTAQDLIQELQSKLRRFKTELADVRISADMQVNIDGFLRFADYFFDGLFADWAVGNRISQSYSSVAGTRNQIDRAISKLNAMESDTDRQIETLKAQLDVLLIQA